jgi:hypothetical protein
MLNKTGSTLLIATSMIGATYATAADRDPMQQARSMIAPPLVYSAATPETLLDNNHSGYTDPHARARATIRGHHTPRSEGAETPDAVPTSHRVDPHENARALIVCRL